MKRGELSVVVTLQMVKGTKRFFHPAAVSSSANSTNSLELSFLRGRYDEVTTLRSQRMFPLMTVGNSEPPVGFFFKWKLRINSNASPADRPRLLVNVMECCHSTCVVVSLYYYNYYREWKTYHCTILKYGICQEQKSQIRPWTCSLRFCIFLNIYNVLFFFPFKKTIVQLVLNFLPWNRNLFHDAGQLVTSVPDVRAVMGCWVLNCAVAYLGSNNPVCSSVSHHEHGEGLISRLLLFFHSDMFVGTDVCCRKSPQWHICPSRLYGQLPEQALLSFSPPSSVCVC